MVPRLGRKNNGHFGSCTRAFEASFRRILYIIFRISDGFHNDYASPRFRYRIPLLIVDQRSPVANPRNKRAMVPADSSSQSLNWA